MTCRIKLEQGFTLIELMMVVAIIGILAGIAMVSYQHFTEKAKAVEAEAALAEVNRLELMHHANHGSYANDLKAIGYSPVPALKYYQVVVQIQNGGAAFQAMALPLMGSGNQLALVLTHTPDGQVGLSKADPKVLAKQLGGVSGGSGASTATPVGAGGAPPGPSGVQAAPGCQAGGEATVAEDGLLDMNFCLQSTPSRNR